MVDEPDADLKFNTLPVPNPAYSDHISSIVDPSVPSPVHFYQPPQQQNSGAQAPSASMDNQFLDSFVSENSKFPETSKGLNETQPGLSHSTPMVSLYYLAVPDRNKHYSGCILIKCLATITHSLCGCSGDGVTCH